MQSSDNVKVALVTGGSLGIGYATALMLLKEGLKVVICSRRQSELDHAIGQLKEIGGDRIAGKTCDVRKYEEVTSLFEFVEKTFGGIDILVNNAGVGLFASVEQMTVEEWQTVIETNLNSLFYCSHEAIPRMRKRGGGYIFNIGSLAGKNAFPNASAYNASKFGLIGFSEAMMQEVRYDNIRVSYILPGSVKTSFRGLNPKDPVSDWKLDPEDVAQVVIDLLHHNPRSLPSCVDIRPSKPKK
ncbi:MAG: short-chain dehydrogenase/reductase SDR [bacterium]|nr:MAG: short-chain dehydrogenase/reductase SDR [bacterium]